MIINGFIIFTFYIVSKIILTIYRYNKEIISSIPLSNFFYPAYTFVFLFKRIMQFQNTDQIITLMSIFKIKTIFNSFICLVFTFILYFFIATIIILLLNIYTL